MVLAALLGKMFAKRRRKKRKSRRQGIPIVRRRYMSDGKSFVTDVLAHTQPGKEKLQFPYEIPVIDTNVMLDDTTTKALYITAGTFALGMVGSAIIKRKS